MTCAAITQDDLLVIMSFVLYGGLAMGFVGCFLYSAVSGFSRWADRAIRTRSLREPFAVRAKRMEDMRAGLLVQVERICERNARELARHG